MHIGLIGGIGPAATEFYYRGLIDGHAKANAALDLTIVHADVREMARNLANGDASRQADTFAALIRRLAAAGADLAAVTSMGGHFCIRKLQGMSPLPILNALPEVAAEIKRKKFKTVGILGTRMVMETRLYGAISSASVVVPEGEALAEVHKNYAEMAKKSKDDVSAFRAWAKKNSKAAKAFADLDKSAKLKADDPVRATALKAIDAALKDYYASF